MTLEALERHIKAPTTVVYILSLGWSTCGQLSSIFTAAYLLWLLYPVHTCSTSCWGYYSLKACLLFNFHAYYSIFILNVSPIILRLFHIILKTCCTKYIPLLHNIKKVYSFVVHHKGNYMYKHTNVQGPLYFSDITCRWAIGNKTM